MRWRTANRFVFGGVAAVLILLFVGAWRLSGEHLVGKTKLIVFHAGSLAVPFQQICDRFEKLHPEVKIVREIAGSRLCARKVAQLHRPCDVLASSDYTVIEELLMPQYATWAVKFAGNEMVIAFSPRYRRAGRINAENWFDVLLGPDVRFGRSDPNCDPCGYRTILLFKLAERYYKRPGLARRLLAKDTRYIRPKEVDLLSLLATGEIDCVFIYRSVAVQHELRMLLLPENINLGSVAFADYYNGARVRVSGKEPHSFAVKTGRPIAYGLTIPTSAPHPAMAAEFVRFILTSVTARTILLECGHTIGVPVATGVLEDLPDDLKPLVAGPGGKACVQ